MERGSRPRSPAATAAVRVLLVIIGAAVGVVVIELGLQTASLVVRQRHATPVTINDDAVRVLCVGESTTATGWPDDLEELLEERHPNLRIQVIREALVGSRTDRFVIAFDDWLETYRPHVVVSMLGINDEGNALVDPPDARDLGDRLRTVQFAKRLIRTTEAERLAAEDVRLARVQINEGEIPDVTDDVAREMQRLSARRTACHDEFRHTEMIEILQEIIRVDPRTPVYHLGAIEGLTLYRPSIGQIERFFEVRIGRPMSSLAPSAQVSRLEQWIVDHPDEWAGVQMLSGWFGQHDQFDAELEVIERYLEHPTFGGWANLRRLIQLRTSFDPDSIPVEVDAVRSALPDTWVWSMVLGHACFTSGWYSIAAQQFERAVAIRSHRPISISDVEYGRIASAWSLAGDGDRARSWYARLGDLQRGRFREFTKRNYRLIVAKVRSRGIPMVAVQYPTLDVLELQRLLEFRDDIVYCDNGESFRRALAEVDSYYELFSDHFAGSFGHFSPAGDRLLASNVAECLAPLLPARG